MANDKKTNTSVEAPPQAHQKALSLAVGAAPEQSLSTASSASVWAFGGAWVSDRGAVWL